MPWIPRCRQVAHLLLSGEDRALRPGERLILRAHFLICRTCPRFNEQLVLMRQATRRWRAYSADGEWPGDGTAPADAS